MESPPIERRSRRSPWASEALHLQLLRAVEDHQLQALTLTDSLGQVWAASSRSPSVPPLLPRAVDDNQGQSRRRRRGSRESPLLVQRLRVGRAVLYLTAQGEAPGGQTALRQAAAGVQRILGALLAG